MQQTPGIGKFAKTLALQNVLQVDFQIAGAGQAVGITQQANLAVIGGQCPMMLGAGVKQFLGKLKSRFLAAVAAGNSQLWQALIQSGAKGRNNDGQAAD